MHWEPHWFSPHRSPLRRPKLTLLGPVWVQTSGPRWSFDGADYLGLAPPEVQMEPMATSALYVFNGGEYEGYCYDLDAPVSSSPVPYDVLSVGRSSMR